MMPACPFCFSKENTQSYLPDTFFHAKNFTYLKCKSCALIYLSPLPTADDYVAMYPPTYQSGLNKTIIADTEKMPGLRFPYKKHFDLINRFSVNKKVLDYGCGQANFIINAKHKGFACDGVEYNPDHLTVLKNEISGSDFFLIEDFLKSDAHKYDVIRLSNVLEHLDHPHEILTWLKAHLNPAGILLVEGPIETNPNLALFVRKIYFRLSKALRKGRKANHPPTHIFFSNSTNQRKFFTDNGLTEIHYEVIECEWPFPESLQEVRGIGSAFKWMIAKTSKFFSKLLGSNLGNTFIYVGKKQKELS